jgi:hypothetical protein
MANNKNLNSHNLSNLYWKDKMSIPKIASLYDLNPSTILKCMKKYGINRRSLAESNYLSYEYKPKFSLKENLSTEEKLLKVAGVMLYCCEGSFKGKGIDFANSNPDIIRLFLQFLRKICGVSESRLRIYLYAFSDQDIEKLKKFWSDITKIPKAQFSKPYLRNSHSPNRSMPYGLVKIRYSDKRLLKVLETWLVGYYNIFINQCGQVAERSMAADCGKRSAHFERSGVKAGEFREALIVG